MTNIMQNSNKVGGPFPLSAGSVQGI